MLSELIKLCANCKNDDFSMETTQYECINCNDKISPICKVCWLKPSSIWRRDIQNELNFSDEEIDKLSLCDYRKIGDVMHVFSDDFIKDACLCIPCSKKEKNYLTRMR